MQRAAVDFLRRYWTLETTANDIISGPVISSSVGRLIACTCPHRWPLPSPRSRNQRPPGHASMVIGIGGRSGVRVGRTHLLEQRGKRVVDRDERTWISCGDDRASDSRVLGRLRPWFLLLCATGRLFALGALLDATELVLPVALELARPFVERADGLGVGAIEHLAAVAPHVDEADVAQHARCFETDGCASPARRRCRRPSARAATR